VTAYYKDAYREAGGPGWMGVSASASIAAHLEAGRYDEAIPLLRTRLQLEPNHVGTLYNLGMVYSDRMQLPEAQELLGRAVQLDPGDANAQVALGIAALRDNDPEAAQGPLEKAVVLQPRNPFALRSLVQLYLMKGDALKALPHLRGRCVRRLERSDQPVHLRPGPAGHRGRLPRGGS
jgi:tetratricopeptide (TPR) repeat protein